MAKTKLDMIKAFGNEVEAVAGPEIRERVIAGCEALSAKTSGAQVALWVREAISRLDASASEATRIKIMETCGYDCTRVNYTAIARGKARRVKFESEEAFLAAEVRKPQKGTRLEWEGNILYQTYIPREYSSPMRCYCGLLRQLPADQKISPTYCNCSKAFVRTLWSEVLGHPVEVEILETAVTGSTECKFKIAI